MEIGPSAGNFTLTLHCCATPAFRCGFFCIQGTPTVARASVETDWFAGHLDILENALSHGLPCYLSARYECA